MSESMEDRYCETELVEPVNQEISLYTATVELTTNVVKNTDSEIRWEMLEKSTDESKDVVL
ncbi:hypothetical protein V5O48_012162, partial [Marasmius crinis-equi]